jgi:hypothetical protein
MHLTEDQKKKLIARESRDLTPAERRDNEFAIRNRLKEFLEFLPDAILIIEGLPKDQLTKNKKLAGVLNDRTIQDLFILTEKLLDLLDYMPVQGSPQKPYVTKILSDETGDAIVRKANDRDFDRNQQLINHVGALNEYYQAGECWMNLMIVHEAKKVLKAKEDVKNQSK